ncbi:MAG: winged helix-turn-helix transcriptional regulator, partial [Propionibacteriaceae bacterium]|nr:winged helix-turn-helix transcriptional regulator [Propionibacteriaceae bacterium]
KVAAPALLPLLRSQAQGEILAWVYLMPGEHSIAEIARETSIPEATVLREINRLVATGFVAERRLGRARLIAPNQHNPATQPLTALLAVTFGPAYVLREQISRLDGIDFAAIHGSWAARATGYAGHAPNDIDLLVVGEVARPDIDAIAEDASNSLRRPVIATIVTLETWLAGEDPFVASVQERPLVTLIDHLDPAAGVR